MAPKNTIQSKVINVVKEQLRSKLIHLSITIARRPTCGLIVFLAVVIGVNCLTAIAADRPEQNDQAVAETGVEFQPRLGDFHYEIRWGGTRVATGVITIEKEDEYYRLTADQESTKFIDRIYRVRYRGETRIKAQDLSPAESVIEETVKNRKKLQETKYDSQTGAANVVETRSSKDQEAIEKKTYELRSDGGIVDVFSAIFLARNFDWRVGERHQFQIFIGEKQYQVTMDCIGTGTFTIDGYTIPVWVIRPGIRKANEDKESPVHKKTLIYISADESKDIVKIKSEPGIGTVKLRLVKFQEK